jgi:uncharacterized protein
VVGSHETFARRASADGFATELSDDAVAFIRARNSAYLATASSDGQPYVQHRGGPQGFIAVLNRRTVAFAEFPGNRQFISSGNLAENARAFLFLMDYANARRLKLWGMATIAGERQLLDRLVIPDAIKAERAIVFAISAIDWNCSKHIPRLTGQSPL